MSIVPAPLLDALREIGDPDLDAGTYAEPKKPPVELDAARLDQAQRLFAAYGTEIGGALLLAALPQSYATAWGSRVLWANATLQDDLVRRIKETAKFVLEVAQRGRDLQGRLWDPSWRPAGDQPVVPDMPPWKRCVELRRFHQRTRVDLGNGDATIKERLGDRNAVPLNQEDLLAMLLSFSITTFEVLEKYGINWSADDQESYLHLWDVIGAYLGIGVPSVIAELKQVLGRKNPLPLDQQWIGLRPAGVPQTRRLLTQLRRRQWLDDLGAERDNGPEALPGRVLTKVLLDELSRAMPKATQRLPLAVMRALAPMVVRDRLNLGGGGIVMRAVETLPRRRYLTGRFTEVAAPNRRGARILRMLGNDVTSRTILRFLGDEGFEIPGLTDR